MTPSEDSAVSLGALCAFGSSITWALGSSAYSRLSRDYSAFSVNLSRSIFALPLFIVTAFILAGGWNAGLDQFASVRWDQLGWFTLSMVASYGLGDVIFLWSTQLLGVPGALAIASCYPIWTATAGWILQGQALAAGQIAGLLIAVGGVVLTILFGPNRAEGHSGGTLSQASRFPRPRLGIALAVATSLCWALNSFSIFRGGQELNFAVSNTIRMGLAVAMSSVIGKMLKPDLPILLPSREISRSWWVFLIEAYGGSAFFMYGLAHTPLAVGATLSSLAPVLSVPVAVAMGLERFSVLRTLGVLFVVLGLRLLV